MYSFVIEDCYRVDVLAVYWHKKCKCLYLFTSEWQNPLVYLTSKMV